MTLISTAPSRSSRLYLGPSRGALATVTSFHCRDSPRTGASITLRSSDGESLYRSCTSNHHHHHLVSRCGFTEEIEQSQVVGDQRRTGSQRSISLGSSALPRARPRPPRTKGTRAASRIPSTLIDRLGNLRFITYPMEGLCTPQESGNMVGIRPRVFLFVFLFGVVFFRAQSAYWLARGVASGAMRASGHQFLGAMARWLDQPRFPQGARRPSRQVGIIAIPLCFLTVGIQTAVNAGAGLVRMRWSTVRNDPQVRSVGTALRPRHACGLRGYPSDCRIPGVGRLAILISLIAHGHGAAVSRRRRPFIGRGPQLRLRNVVNRPARRRSRPANSRQPHGSSRSNANPGYRRTSSPRGPSATDSWMSAALPDVRIMRSIRIGRAGGARRSFR